MTQTGLTLLRVSTSQRTLGVQTLNGGILKAPGIGWQSTVGGVSLNATGAEATLELSATSLDLVVLSRNGGGSAVSASTVVPVSWSDARPGKGGQEGGDGGDKPNAELRTYQVPGPGGQTLTVMVKVHKGDRQL